MEISLIRWKLELSVVLFFVVARWVSLMENTFVQKKEKAFLPLLKFLLLKYTEKLTSLQ